MKEARLLQPKTTYTIDYPAAIEAATQQMNVFWSPDEIAVEKDLHDLKTNFTEAETHGVITTLKLFTLYEVVVGRDYWSGTVTKAFPRPDIQRMASCFSFFELNVHAPFYNKLNEVLGLATDEFYSSYVKDPVLKARMDSIGSYVDADINDPLKLLVSIGVFSLIEGAVLYSSFAFLKHFQAEGKNKLVNVTAGINFSVRDENIHAESGAWLYRTLRDELGLTSSERDKVESKIKKAAQKIREHEYKIIDMIFEKGAIKGITSTQMANFVDSRIHLCLKNLDVQFEDEVSTYNPIAKWFYKNINGAKLHDFFFRLGSEYNRDWSENNFVWRLPKDAHPVY